MTWLGVFLEFVALISATSFGIEIEREGSGFKAGLYLVAAVVCAVASRL